MTSSPSLSSPHEPAVDPVYLDWLWTEWQRDPSSVTEDWQCYFKGCSDPSQSSQKPSSPTPSHLTQPTGGKDQTFSKLEKIIQAFRSLGHLHADLNPLAAPQDHPDYLKPSYYGLSTDHSVALPVPGFSDHPLTILEITQKLQNTYTRSIGADYAHLQNPQEKLWLERQMESCENKPGFSHDIKKAILKHLAHAEMFERFLHRRYLGKKRFSLEGLDSLISMLHFLSDHLSHHGCKELCIGMAHRGRLSVLINFMQKPMEQLIQNFEDSEFNPFDIDGDVKYHIGYGSEITTFSQHKLAVYLAPNPSHLESVSPVIKGFVKGRQRILQDTDHKKVIPLLLHGDASFCGQGVVTEMLNLSKLTGYSCGGSIHIVLNNQVGFTTSPHESRSCHYATDLAKFVDSPILHVNADDPEACIWATELASQYRNKFHKDFFIDLIGYRRHGHNESDEPSFTQPLMYSHIKKHPTVFTSYSQQCIDHKILTEDEIRQISSDITHNHQQAYKRVKDNIPHQIAPDLVSQFHLALNAPKTTKKQLFEPINTTADEAVIQMVLKSITTTTPSFAVHPKVKKVLEARRLMIQDSSDPHSQQQPKKVDWATAELLGLGTCAHEGHHVRLTGQDVKRGTFSSRHIAITHTESGESYELFHQIKTASHKPVSTEVINSPLSELGCLGFEYGYSVADEQALVLWEAQFGDFANGAQIMIDQFFAASEDKWQQTAGCVMLLPHGYEGQGPEHSSARLERYLQLCGGGNLQVVNCSTPAQHFHVLRRQVKRSFRKPLIAMTPKSLLRDPLCVSQMSDLANGSFQEVMDDSTDIDNTIITTIILCSGKITYDALKYRQDHHNTDDHAIIRIEQLYPFPESQLLETLKGYPHAKHLIWLQEEPQNMGAWSYIRTYLEESIEDKTIHYVGRKASGSTAEGSKRAHLTEQDRIIKQAFGHICSWPPSPS